MPFSLPGWTGELAADVRPADLAAAVRALTDPAAALKTLHWGRNYLYLARLETADGPLDVVVKQYRNRTRRDRLKRRLQGSKAEKSWRIANALLAAGIATPAPVMRIESASADGPVLLRLPLPAGHHRGALSLPRRQCRRGGRALPRGRLPRLRRSAGDGRRGACTMPASGTATSPAATCSSASARTAVPPRSTSWTSTATRMGRPPSVSERLRDLSRLALFNPEHQELLLRSYWGAPAAGLRRAPLPRLSPRLPLEERRQEGRARRSRPAEAAAPAARRARPHPRRSREGAGARDKAVWDHLSDQPHQHAGRLEKLRVRLADVRSHGVEAAVVAGALPRIRRRYRELKRELHAAPVDFAGVGVGVRPWPENPAGLLALIEELGVRHVLLRLHPWEEDHGAEEELARELHARGLEVTFALPQNRDLVRDPARWRRALEAIAPRFTPYGRRFQIGQAINRSKWGIWNLREYLELARAAEEVLRPLTRTSSSSAPR